MGVEIATLIEMRRTERGLARRPGQNAVNATDKAKLGTGLGPEAPPSSRGKAVGAANEVPVVVAGAASGGRLPGPPPPSNCPSTYASRLADLVRRMAVIQKILEGEELHEEVDRAMQKGRAMLPKVTHELGLSEVIMTTMNVAYTICPEYLSPPVQL